MSGFGSDALGVPLTGLPVLRELIHERTGLSYGDDRTELLAERIAPLVLARGFRSFLDLFYLLKYDEEASPAGWRDVLDALSVPETYFWREVDQIRAVSCHVVPELVRRGAEMIRIWSAPCATGEEPLTIAMALSEAGWFDRVAIEIHGSDGSAGAIAKARAGVYRQRAMRATRPDLVEKYFTSDGAAFKPVPELSRRVTSWSVVNLMDPDAVAVHARSPIIFCRNVFIYFSPQSIKRTIEHLAALMPTPGYLCVGASESLLTLTSAFSLEEIDRAFIYVKRGGDE